MADIEQKAHADGASAARKAIAKGVPRWILTIFDGTFAGSQLEQVRKKTSSWMLFCATLCWVLFESSLTRLLSGFAQPSE